jgi:riboflavin biosynthesis pyrimidine reductase
VQRCFPDHLDAPDDDALAAAYAWPDAAGFRPVLRANMVASLDGAISVDGRSAGLGSDGDQRIFAVLRDLADVLLVGAGTIRAEGYGGIRLGADRLTRRRRWGLGAPPRVAVVTARGLDAELGIFTDSEAPPLVITTAAGASRMSGFPATIVEAGTGTVDLPLMVAKLGELGLRRVLCEGGPGLLGRLIAEDLLDELCLTGSPQTVGGPTSTMLGDVRLADPVRWELETLHLEQSNLFCRYRRAAR